MPTLTQVSNAVLPAGMTMAQWLASRRGLNQATQTVQQGATAASGQLNVSSAAAIAAQRAALEEQRRIAAGNTGRTDDANAAALAAQKEALATQRGVYDKTVADNDPYSQFGTQSIKQLQELQRNPSSLRSDPGYQFGLDETLKTNDRARQAQGTFGNGGLERSSMREALNYASTKYNEAWDRLMKATGVGERANAANASAGVTFGNQSQTNANNVGNLETSGAQENNQTMATLGAQVGANADKTGNIGINNAEDQASLTLAQAELAAKNQGLQGNNTTSVLGDLAKAVPTIASLFTKGGAAAPSLAKIAAGAVPEIPLAGIGGGVAAAPATGIAGAMGLGGGAGLFGLGAATIPVVGGIIAGGALLANHFIGEGRKAADKLTGEGGIQHAFEDTLNLIDAQPVYTEAQKWESKVQAYDKLEQLALEFSKKGKNERKVASQMFDTIAPLFGKPNPLKRAA